MQSLIGPFYSVVPNILISRFMLNLRTVYSPEEMSAERQQYSGLQFAANSIIGNIGAPLGRESMEEEAGNGEE
ncbi:hypothetical protein GYMLUDRAFT_50193 [Collybiopsis luxurians FD-317 M1]|uniref:Uncharacterized protein n=1 Tax=Collybiopsis luxurians FD-317 M1 TaxID=944289 RepID=A0A0D0BQT7_9AGAR|nr:hypothetical protein GYMLUDRAFT_50193 [Collybiopsis luxurians FD-317 M1]